MALETKANRLVELISKEEGNSCDFYTVPEVKNGTFTGKHWSVIHNLTKQSWSCNCLYYALKQKECSHTLACKKYEEALNGKEKRET